ncbi:MAG: hypothetical protein IKV82_06915 [Akkermansia sp.]|nr:hypothetical protein [Akkermansia sp.]
MNSWSSSLILLSMLLVVSCQQQQQQHHPVEEEEKEEQTILPPLHLGAVHQVYPEQHFALLRIIGPMPGPGVTLITHPADGSTSRIGNLVISTGQPARNNIIAADIRSGTVMKGDRVFRYRNIAAQESRETAVEADTPEEIQPAHTETQQEAGPSSPAPDETPNINKMSDENFPTPAPVQEEEPETADGDTILESHPAPSVDIEPTGAPVHASPSYLNDIPDDINQWD